MGVTSRLYYADCYLNQFEASILRASPDGLQIELDRTAFYPTSGGQLFDTGTLNSVAVVEVSETEDGRILHHMAAPLQDGQAVQGRIDFARRFDFMQQHTGQHLLSAVFESLFGFKTVGVHMGESSSTVDLAAGSISREQLIEVEARVNEAVFQNRTVSIGFEDAAQAGGLRKATDRTGELRIVTIEGYDRSACGGTHVRATGEIGPVLLRRLDKIRGNVRVEFLCGARALRRARQDYDTLDAVARVFNAALDDVPSLAAASVEQARESGKALKRLTLELAQLRGRQLWEQQPVSSAGRRVYLDARPSGPLEDETRALALSFTAQPAAVFVASSPEPPAVLLAVSEDTGLHAGNLLKPLLSEAGGRGGGNARTAQGSLPSPEAVKKLIATLRVLVS